MPDVVILGGGIAGLSLASFLKCESMVLEKNEKVGGLARSHNFYGIDCDIGPHIIFSKNKKVLDLHTSMIETNELKRSNKILYKGRFVKYPFENGLGDLPKFDRDVCLNGFLENPYERYDPQNMLQFFLKTFGDGMTNSYLKPYNEKIWKFDTSCMDLQMVERIPRPPNEDIIASANGIETEGYKHQLYFHYPKKGGFQSLIDAYAKKADVLTNAKIDGLSFDGRWRVGSSRGTLFAKKLVSTIPLPELFKLLPTVPFEVQKALDGLLYNSIHVVLIQAKKDNMGENFALYVPDENVVFHRISKLDFLGDAYKRQRSSTLMAEVTFRGAYEDNLGRVLTDLDDLGLVKREDVISAQVFTEKYAYPIYDLNHRQNADCVLEYLKSIGIECVGRFAQWEYLNTDGVVERTMNLAHELNEAAYA